MKKKFSESKKPNNYVSPFDTIPLSETEREVWKQLNAQQSKGRQRYKVAMSYKQNMDPVAWAQEIIEELVDALQYAVAFKMVLEKTKITWRAK